MWDQIYKWFSEHNRVLGWVLISVIAAISGTAFVLNRYYKWEKRVSAAEDECKKIDGHIMPKLDTIGTSITILTGTITSLAGSFNNLVVHLGAKDTTIDKGLFMSRSPLQLTPLGLKVLDAINGKAFVDAHEEYLISQMDVLGVKTALDSQTIAPLIINKVSTEDFFNNIKNYLFSNPIYRTTDANGGEIAVNLDMSTVSNVLGIYLRDKYLARHPELKPEDIPNILPSV
jgi:hypothetical protein